MCRFNISPRVVNVHTSRLDGYGVEVSFSEKTTCSGSKVLRERNR